MTNAGKLEPAILPVATRKADASRMPDAEEDMKRGDANRMPAAIFAGMPSGSADRGQIATALFMIVAVARLAIVVILTIVVA